jgi:hypothetical protein
MSIQADATTSEPRPKDESPNSFETIDCLTAEKVMLTCSSGPTIFPLFRGTFTFWRTASFDSGNGPRRLGSVLFGIVGAKVRMISLHAILTWLLIVALDLALATWPACSA